MPRARLAHLSRHRAFAAHPLHLARRVAWLHRAQPRSWRHLAQRMRPAFGGQRLALRRHAMRMAFHGRPRRLHLAHAARSRLALGERMLHARDHHVREHYAARTGVQVGRASYYSGSHTTASGGHVGAATCASRTLPFGTKVLVTNLANAHRMVLTVNDRGPYVGGRIVDVSRGAAGQLGMVGSGVAPVRVEVLARR